MPVDLDSVVIAAGHVVTFDVDQSAFGTGIAGVTVTGELRFATDGTVTYLKASGHISGAGKFYVGNSAVDPIPAPAGATPEVATLAFNGAFQITMTGEVGFYGEEREPFYAIASKTDNTHIVLAGAGALTWLRAGDVIGISDSTVSGPHSPSSETYTVDAYDPNTRTITLNAGTPLTRLINQNGATDNVALLSRCILATNLTKTASLVYARSNGTARGARFYNFSPGPINQRTGWTIGYCTGQNNTYGGIAYYGSGHTISGCTGQNNTYGGIANWGSGHTISGCTGQNNTPGGIVHYGSGHTISGCTGQNNAYGGIAYYGSGHTISGCTGQNNTYGGIVNWGSGHTISGCTGQNNTYGGIAHWGAGHTIIASGNGNANNTGGDLYYTQTCRLKNCLLPHATEYAGYTDASRRADHYSESLDHDQVAGAFKAWCRGGIVTAVATPLVTGRLRSYQHACESAISPCYWQRRATVEPGHAISVTAWLRKDMAMAYLPRVQIIDPFADPLAMEAETPLAEATMTSDAIDTWQEVTISWTNPSLLPREVIVRALAMNATGNAYSDLVVVQCPEPGEGALIDLDAFTGSCLVAATLEGTVSDEPVVD
jgi:hypothetical protein